MNEYTCYLYYFRIYRIFQNAIKTGALMIELEIPIAQRLIYIKLDVRYSI